jgi:DNA-binding PadR family transcriptional regulator
MQRTETLRQFEQLVLAAVRKIENAYGMAIHQMVEQLYGRRVNSASVYNTLNRLEAKGYVTAETLDNMAQHARG